MISKQQKAQIYCIKHGHANYIYEFLQFVYCGRCGEQIGDHLAGVYDVSDKILINHTCDICNNLKKKLSKLDKEILKRLEADKEAISYDYEKLLKGLKI